MGAKFQQWLPQKMICAIFFVSALGINEQPLLLKATNKSGKLLAAGRHKRYHCYHKLNDSNRILGTSKEYQNHHRIDPTMDAGGEKLRMNE
jgi:hypothetical protein